MSLPAVGKNQDFLTTKFSRFTQWPRRFCFVCL